MQGKGSYHSVTPDAMPCFNSILMQGKASAMVLPSRFSSFQFHSDARESEIKKDFHAAATKVSIPF